jgi:hypothetical protein
LTLDRPQLTEADIQSLQAAAAKAADAEAAAPH